VRGYLLNSGIRLFVMVFCDKHIVENMNSMARSAIIATMDARYLRPHKCFNCDEVYTM
jgi:hypothetical protein